MIEHIRNLIKLYFVIYFYRLSNLHACPVGNDNSLSSRYIGSGLHPWIYIYKEYLLDKNKYNHGILIVLCCSIKFYYVI